MSTQPNVGEIIEGKITGITKFGVFVEIGNGVTGRVHISEVAKTYVNEIRDFVKEDDKVKVLAISEDGKISLSMKRAMEDEKAERPRRQSRNFMPPKPDNSFVWTSSRNEGASFEDMMT